MGDICWYCGTELRLVTDLSEETRRQVNEASDRMAAAQEAERARADEARLAGKPHTRAEGLGYDPYDYYRGVRVLCERCGWWVEALRGGHYDVYRTFAAGLREFGINDRQLFLEELSSHLSRHFSDVYNLSARRFEELVAHILRATGLRAELTKQSRDGGADVLCFNNDGGLVVVEVKRYAPTRSVGIGVVDRLLGVRFRTRADEAVLVTSSYFTRPATAAATEANEGETVLRLVDAHSLLGLLEAYADPQLTLGELRRIFDKPPVPDE